MFFFFLGCKELLMALLPKMKDEDCVIEVAMCPSHLFALLINSGLFVTSCPSP